MARNLKFTCGTIVPSSCVPYTGKKLAFLTDEEQPECDADINEVIDKISIAIDALEKATDTSGHNVNCLTVSGDKNVKNILQAQTDKICSVKASVDSIQTQIASDSVASKLITIDLGCLSAGASACQTGTNTYSLLALLTLFKSEICAIKSHLGI